MEHENIAENMNDIRRKQNSEMQNEKKINENKTKKNEALKHET